MLAVFVILLLWLAVGRAFSVCFPLSVFILIVGFLFSIFSGYSGFLGCSFVRLYGRIDMLRVLLVRLSMWVRMLMFLVRVKYRFNALFPSLFSFSVGGLIVIVIVFFFTDSLLLFYVRFEFSLLPTLYLVLKWGYQPERLQAGLYFMMYTICGSLPLLLVLMYLQFFSFSSFMVFSYPFYFLSEGFSSYLFYLGLLFAFLVKVPIWGVHL